MSFHARLAPLPATPPLIDSHSDGLAGGREGWSGRRGVVGGGRGLFGGSFW